MAESKERRKKRPDSPNLEVQLLMEEGQKIQDRILNYTWDTWVNTAATKSKSWVEGLEKCGYFSTYEEFWREYKKMTLPKNMKHGWNLSVFKQGIKPVWEDPINCNGGRWVVIFDQDETFSNYFWYNTLLCIVLELFEENMEDVCGVVYQRRKAGDKICIWTTDAFKNDGAGIKSIGKVFKEELGADGASIHYVTHQEYQTGESEVKKFTYSV